jgi:hypothetical protein
MKWKIPDITECKIEMVFNQSQKMANSYIRVRRGQDKNIIRKQKVASVPKLCKPTLLRIATTSYTRKILR